MNFGSSRRRELDIEMAPLVDVVFLLLVFFLLTSTFIRFRTLDLTLDAVVAAGEAAARTAVVVRIDERGEVTLAGEWVRVAELGRSIRERFELRSGTIAMVLTAPNVRLQSLVTVLEHVRESGIRDVRIGRLQ